MLRGVPENLKIFLLVPLGIVLGLLTAEIMLRIFYPCSSFSSARELSHFQRKDVPPGLYMPDDEIGYRPVFGKGPYTQWGTLTNSYSITKKKGITRLLFIGDSVTARGKIVNALKNVYGEECYEYWNAGVESFNTIQEVLYYIRYNSRIKPDHVILTFHPNDFETIPVAFYSIDGRLHVFAPNFPSRLINHRLFVNSLLYRLILGWLYFSKTRLDEIIKETEDALAKLQTVLNRDNINLTVLVLPVLKPPQSWDSAEKLTHAQIIDILQRLKIRYFDLLPALAEPLEKGMKLRESHFDFWHPDEKAAQIIAHYLYTNGLLQTK